MIGAGRVSGRLPRRGCATESKIDAAISPNASSRKSIAAQAESSLNPGASATRSAGPRAEFPKLVQHLRPAEAARVQHLDLAGVRCRDQGHPVDYRGPLTPMIAGAAVAPAIRKMLTAGER
ncbi:MAG: hypothetical protein ACRDTV_23245, partial [Mycobacterium sp.]